ncbi:DedA family protein [Acidithiobacillus caldus]
MVIEFLRHYGYGILFLGTLLEGEAVVVVAGALAQAGILELPWVIAAAFAGSTINDQVLYQVGYRYGDRVLGWIPLFLRRHVVKAEGLIRRYGNVITLVFRFIYGTRTITPILLGVHRYPPRRYLWMNPLAALIWAVVLSVVGYLLGASLRPLLRNVHNVQLALLGLLIVGAIVAWWLHRRRR